MTGSSPRIVCIRNEDPAAALTEAFAARERGEVPLIGDDRWADAHWREVRERFHGSPAAAGAAWATFTSGSTGAPRVVVRCTESWSSSFAAVTDLVGLSDADTVALPVSVVSSMTVFQAAHARHVGARVVLPRHHALDDAQLASATVVHGTPLLCRDLLRRVAAGRERGERFALRCAIIGGEHVDAELRALAASLDVRVIAYAGAAELSFLGVDDDGSGLRPFPGAELRIAADATLWVRSPYVALGYAAGAAGPLERRDGWATVGDRARIERMGPAQDERIVLLGRSDGAIMSAGATVVPSDVEATLRELPGVADALVAGIEVPRVGQLVAAVVVLDGTREVSDIRRAAAARLPRSHVPRRWHIASALPRTLSGKIDRAAATKLLARPKEVARD